jgi:hypothetical protein
VLPERHRGTIQHCAAPMRVLSVLLIGEFAPSLPNGLSIGRGEM